MKESSTTHTLYNVYRYVPYDNGFVSILPKEEPFMTKCCDAPLACDGEYLNETAMQLAKEYGMLGEKNKLPERWLAFNVHVVELVFDKEWIEVLEARPFDEDFFQMVLKHMPR